MYTWPITQFYVLWIYSTKFFSFYFFSVFFFLFLLSFLFIAWAFIASAKCNQQSLAHSIFSALSRSIIYLKCLEAYNALTRMDVQIYLCRLFLFSLSWLLFSRSLFISLSLLLGLPLNLGQLLTWNSFSWNILNTTNGSFLSYFVRHAYIFKVHQVLNHLFLALVKQIKFFFFNDSVFFYCFSVVSCVCMSFFSKMVYYKSLVVIASNCIEGSFYFILPHFK